MPDDRRQVLLVGAGAVGQVYGYYLSKAGAEVSFFTRDKHAETTRKGFNLYRIPSFRISGKDELRDPTRFDSFLVLTRLEDVAAKRWDHVYLCMSSPALRSGWLPDFAHAVGAETTFVLFQLGLEDLEYASSCIPTDRLVSGSVGFSSYAAPLPGETITAGEGTAYWLAAAAFSGPASRTSAVVELLQRGGFPAKQVPDARAAAAVGETIAAMVVAALPTVGWSFKRLSQDRALLQAVSAATRQALAVCEQTIHVRVGAARLLVRPILLRWALRIVPFLAPSLIEQFFRFHFTKVADQIVSMLETYARLARAHGLPADAIQDLLTRRLTVEPRRDAGGDG